ncbi:riboflavin biosynthesis protein RibF [Isosphaeraceae bacterium EP7]
MFTLSRLEDVPALARGAYLAIGNFDGVHRGHARLIGRLRALADAAGVPAVAVTFDPHPVALLRPESAPVPLAWTDRNIELLEQAGASEVGVFRTGPWLLELTAREFFDRVIAGQFAAIGMVEGPNFGFGRARGGDTRQLSEWCADAGIALEVIPPTEVDGQLVSSSRIRADLAEGRVSEAAALLGRPHRIRGMVTHGAGRGAGLGVPTANLDEIDTIIPAHGVYAALAYIDGEGTPLPAACNVGPNPTFGEQEQKVEAHLIDFRGDLYGRTVHLDFLERLRGTRPFGGLEDLLTQIAADVERSRGIAARAIRGN